jgi:hypothetical protein
MTIAILVLLALLAAFTAAGPLLHRAPASAEPETPADRLLADRLHDRFVVTTATGESFDGLLIDVDDKTVVLRDASTFHEGNRVAVDGEVVLRRDAIAYMQKP